MPESTPVEFAVLGCSHPHARAHVGTLRSTPEVRRIHLWDPERSAAEALAPEAGEKLAVATDDLASLLTNDAIGFALVCRENDVNPETAIQAAEAGKHIFSEKPVARGVAELLPVLEAVRRAGVALGVCYQWRRHPASVELRRLRSAGVFGELMAVEARMVTSQVKFRNPEHWLFKRERAGGGILSWLGCHWLDLLRFILQDEVAAVSAMTGVRGGFPITVEDTAAVAMRWRSGALGTFHAGYHLPLSIPGYNAASYDGYLAVRGQQGNFWWDPTGSATVVHLESAHPDFLGAPKRELGYDIEPAKAYGGRYGLEFLREFIADALAGRPPRAGGEDALRVLQFCEAVQRSQETGRQVELAA